MPSSGQGPLCTLFSYGANGRLTRRDRRTTTSGVRIHDFRWDGDDRLRKVKEGSNDIFRADYDGDGLRASAWDLWKGQHNYTWSPWGILYDANAKRVFWTAAHSRQISRSSSAFSMHPAASASRSWRRRRASRYSSSAVLTNRLMFPPLASRVRAASASSRVKVTLVVPMMRSSWHTPRIMKAGQSRNQAQLFVVPQRQHGAGGTSPIQAAPSECPECRPQPVVVWFTRAPPDSR